MKYLVTRVDAVQGHPRAIKTSELWPALVDAESPEQAIEVALAEHGFTFPQAPRQVRAWYVVPMNDAVIVSLKARPDYDIITEPYFKREG